MDKVRVEINTLLNEIFSKSIISQQFSNQSRNSIELKILIFKNPNLIFSSFNAKIGDFKQVQFIERNSSGNVERYIKEESDKYIINLGNIQSKERVVFISEFFRFNENKKSFQFELFRNLPIFKSGDTIFQNEDLTGKVEILSKNKIINIRKDILIPQLQIIEEKYQNERNYIISYKIDKLSENYEYENDYIPCSRIYFDIDREEPIIYFLKSPFDENKEYYRLQYVNKIIKSSKNLYRNPALMIFLVDQSGSMNGKLIQNASKIIELFLNSLPTYSYYQIIGFGSTYIKYEEIPIENTKQNIDQSLEKVRHLEANLGGTNIYWPLYEIYNNYRNIYEKYNLPKSIILLTDGGIEDKNTTLNLIDNNNSKFSIFLIEI